MTNSLVDQLLQTILNGAHGPSAAGSTYVVLESPTRPIDAALLAGLHQANGVGEASQPLELFSRLVDDDMPMLYPEWQSSGLRLADVYSQMLFAQSDSPAVNANFAEARQLFEAMTVGSTIQPDVTFQPSWPNPVSWAAPEAEPMWTSLEIKDQQPQTHPAFPAKTGGLAEWPDLVTLELADEPSLISRPSLLDPFPRPIRRGSPGLLDRLSRSETHEIATSFNFAESAVGKPIYDPENPPGPLGPSDNPSYPWPKIAPKPVPRPWPSDPPLIILKPARPAKASVPPPSPASLKLKYIRVSITRRWLNGLLLRLPGWSVQGFDAGYFSTGTKQKNSGIAPLLPTSFVAVKDLEITGSWNNDDGDDLQKRLLGMGPATFGPFTLANNGSSLGSFDGSTLRIPGIAILAWYCNVMPPLPPVSGV